MNSIHIRKLKKEYEKELKLLKEKYSKKLVQQVKKDLNDNIVISCGMGATVITNIENGKDLKGVYTDTLHILVWDCGLSFPNKLSKKRELSIKQTNQIYLLYRDAGVKGSLFFSNTELKRKNLVSVYEAHNRYLQGAPIDANLIKKLNI